MEQEPDLSQKLGLQKKEHQVKNSSNWELSCTKCFMPKR